MTKRTKNNDWTFGISKFHILLLKYWYIIMYYSSVRESVKGDNVIPHSLFYIFLSRTSRTGLYSNIKLYMVPSM
jgi:hypothetical protein